MRRPIQRSALRTVLVPVVLAGLSASAAALQVDDLHFTPASTDVLQPQSFEVCRRLAAADWDEDGRDDLLCASLGGSQLLRSQGGSLVVTGALPAAHAATTGDWNGDGHLDGALVTPGSLLPLFGDGLGDPHPVPGGAMNILGGDLYGSLVGADVNGDGQADFITIDRANAYLLAWKWDQVTGAYGVTLGTFLAGLGIGTPRDLVAADFDEDGRPEIAICSHQPNGVMVLDFTIVTPTLWSLAGGPLLAAGTTPYSLAVLDANADGHVDLAVGDVTLQEVVVLAGQGDGTFVPAGAHDASQWPGMLVAGDLDGDGAPDVAALHNGSHDVAVLLNDGGGTLEKRAAYGVIMDPYGANGFAPLDVDGDARLDLAAACTTWTTGGQGWLTILRNASPGPWHNLGLGLAGDMGRTPLLTGSGALQAGNNVTLALSGALKAAMTQGTTSHLLVGLSLLALPFKGGVMGPAPDLGVYGLVSSGSSSSAQGAGNVVLTFPWPAGVPAGTQFWVQHWVVDPDGPAGFAASNTLRGDA